MSEFFAMGGYAVYVWPSFLLTAGVMVAAAVLARRRHRKAVARIRRIHEINEQ